MFQLTKVEAENLRLQFATSRSGHGGRRSLPYVFTEQGVAMLSTVLNSEQAIEVNITIMRAFVKLRQMLESNEELNRKFAAVIRKLATHDKYFKVVFDELKRLTEQPTPSRNKSDSRQARSCKDYVLVAARGAAGSLKPKGKRGFASVTLGNGIKKNSSPRSGRQTIDQLNNSTSIDVGSRSLS